jgi:4-aminobutyrate aminotransferase-like enzyme
MVAFSDQMWYSLNRSQGQEGVLKAKDYTLLQVELAEAYRRYAPRSAAVDETARQVLVDGGSHAIRLIRPFPPRVVAARGAWIQDEDGHDILDFWQGHLGNILGHNPDVVTATLAQALQGGFGLHTGLGSVAAGTAPSPGG